MIQVHDEIFILCVALGLVTTGTIDLNYHSVRFFIYSFVYLFIIFESITSFLFAPYVSFSLTTPFLQEDSTSSPSRRDF